jgi:hypothetical protein
VAKEETLLVRSGVGGLLFTLLASDPGKQLQHDLFGLYPE